MNKISTRDIQLLVAGAFALMGFRAFIQLPYLFMGSPDFGRIAACIWMVLALPIGIAILMGRATAILVARTYLWIAVIAGIIVLSGFGYFVPNKVGLIALRTAPDLLVAIVLLGLIFWSRSRRFRNEPDA